MPVPLPTVTFMMRWLVSMEAAEPKRYSRLVKQFWNYVYNASYQLLVIAAALVTTPYLARSLGPGALGVYGYIVSVASILQTLALLSLYTYGSRQVAYSRDSASEVNQVFWELMAIRCLLGVVVSVAYWGIALITPYTQLFLIYYPWMLANILDVTWFFIGFEDMKVVVLKNVAVKIACVLSIFCFVRNENGLVTYLMIMSVFTFLGNVSVYPQLQRYVGKPDINQGFMRLHLSNAVKLFIPEVTSNLTHRINHITMGHVLDTADDIAFFDQGEKIINIPSSLVTAMNSVVMPRMANDHARQKDNSVEDYAVAVGSAELMVAIPLAVGVASVADRLVPWFFGPGFERAIPVIQIMSPLIVIDSLIGIVGAQYLTATNKTTVLNQSNGLGLCMNIVLNMLLVPMAGCIGAVLSTVFARLAILAYQVLVTLNGLTYSSIARSALRYSAASLVMMAVVLFAGQLVENDLVCTVVQVPIGCLTYLALLIAGRDPVLQTLYGVLARDKVAS